SIKTNLNPNNPDDKLFWAIALTAFYGLARLGELLPATQQDKDKVPCFCALRFEKAYITRADRSWTTKRFFINKLKQLLPTEDVAGHSFRAGGTTELVMRGVGKIAVGRTRPTAQHNTEKRQNLDT
ncbi:18704_t:CDS:2, partial [Racocetra persica]